MAILKQGLLQELTFSQAFDELFKCFEEKNTFMLQQYIGAAKRLVEKAVRTLKSNNLVFKTDKGMKRWYYLPEFEFCDGSR